MQTWQIGALVLLVVVCAALLFVRRSRASSTDDPDDRLDTVLSWPPTATRVLTGAERLAYGVLVKAMPGHMILAQVPLARFLKVPTRHSYSEWLRRLGTQCADLVVCDMASEVVAVVSIQAPAGEASERARKRLNRMARVLKAADIPMHVWTQGVLPSPEVARELLLPAPRAAAPSLSGTPPVRAADPVAPTPSRPSPFDDIERDSKQDERVEMLEPPPSTWFDEFNSGPTPLSSPGSGTKSPGKPTGRP